MDQVLDCGLSKGIMTDIGCGFMTILPSQSLKYRIEAKCVKLEHFANIVEV